MVPPPFQTLRALRTLNLAAIACAMASLTAALLGGVANDLEHSLHALEAVAFVTGVPTALVGALWAWVLRSQRTVGRTTLRWGWVLSLPLAMANASLSCGLLLAYEALHSGDPSVPSGFLTGLLVGALGGAIVWLPALVMVLLCFGAPIARAQRLAQQGLAGEEHGEKIVGTICAALSVAALALASQQPPGTTPVEAAGRWFTALLAAGGLLAGGAAAALAFRREQRRRGFVAGVEAGKVHGYRVDTTGEGKVLVRVMARESYRVADFEEEVFELDAGGVAVRAKVVGEGGEVGPVSAASSSARLASRSRRLRRRRHRAAMELPDERGEAAHVRHPLTELREALARERLQRVVDSRARSCAAASSLAASRSRSRQLDGRRNVSVNCSPATLAGSGAHRARTAPTPPPAMSR